MSRLDGYRDKVDLDSTNGSFRINGVDVSATAAEVNALSGIIATVDELNELDDVTSFADSTVAVAVEAGDAIAVTVTLNDAAAAAVNEARPVDCWLSDSATAGTIATDDTITVTASTGAIIKETTDDLYFKCVTSTDGVLVLSVAHAGNATVKYLWVQFPNGKCKVSAAIDLA